MELTKPTPTHRHQKVFCCLFVLWQGKAEVIEIGHSMSRLIFSENANTQHQTGYHVFFVFFFFLFLHNVQQHAEIRKNIHTVCLESTHTYMHAGMRTHTHIHK